MQRPIMLSLPQLTIAGLGFVPISCLSAHLFGFVPLPQSARLVALPAAVLALGLGLQYPQLGRRALVGLLAGMIATGMYDAARLSFVALGLWGDFIPNIGRIALDDQGASPVWGYLWRFVCNGGAMGAAFAVLPVSGVRQGMAYGTFICCCLFGTLVFAPGAQSALFRLTALTGSFALVGHVIYGGVLGGLTRRWLAGIPLPVVDPSEDVFAVLGLRPAPRALAAA